MAAGSDLTAYLAQCLGTGTTAIAREALARHCCARCALRYAGISRRLFAQLPTALVETTLRAFVSTGRSTPPLPAPAVCAACCGFLQKCASLRIPGTLEADAATHRHRAAASSLGQAFAADGKLKGEREALVARTAFIPSDDWAWTAACGVAAGGYDLRGGLAFAIVMDAELARADAELYWSVMAAVGGGAPSAQARQAGGKAMPMPLKSSLRSMLLLSLNHVFVEDLPAGASLHRVDEYPAALAQGADVAGAAGGSGGAAAISSGPSSSTAIRSGNPANVTLPLGDWVDMGAGVGVSGYGADSDQADWDVAVAPSLPIFGAVDNALILAASPLLGIATAASSVLPAASAAADSRSATARVGPLRGMQPLHLSQQSGLLLTVVIEPARHGGAGEGAAAASGGGKKKQSQSPPTKKARSANALAGLNGPNSSGDSTLVVTAPHLAAAAGDAASSVPGGAPASSASPAAAFDSVVEGGDASSIESSMLAATGSDEALSTSAGVAPTAAAAPAAAAAVSSPLARMTVSLQRGPIFVKARYNKFARGLSQSPWFVDGKRLGAYPSSVEEMVAGGIVGELLGCGPPPVDLPAVAAAAVAATVAAAASARHHSPLMLPRVTILPHCVAAAAAAAAIGAASAAAADSGAGRGTGGGGWTLTADPAAPFTVAPALAETSCSYKFHAAGREDVDVRMLGNGEFWRRGRVGVLH